MFILICLGIVSGILYGVLAHITSARTLTFLQQLTIWAAKITVLAAAVQFLAYSTCVEIALFVICFLVAFWYYSFKAL